MIELDGWDWYLFSIESLSGVDWSGGYGGICRNDATLQKMIRDGNVNCTYSRRGTLSLLMMLV